MNILITGTSRGIGWGLARFYLENGHQVYGLSRTSSEDLNSHSGFHFLSCDLTKITVLQQQLKDFLSSAGQFDLVVLNAGILGQLNDLKDTSTEQLQNLMMVNVWANKEFIDLVAATVPVKMIVGMSSGASVSGSRGWNGYSISKAGLNMLIKLYAKENIDTKFYAFAPGLVDTAMQDYICGEVDGTKFPTVERIKSARGTDVMPGPEQAGKLLADAFDRLGDYESGSFVDIRQMD